MNRLCLVSFTLMVMMSFASSASVTIKKLRYEPANDALVITAEFAGKCLVHELVLTKKGGSESEHRFELTVTNPVDVCNGMNSLTQSFSMESVLLRPAQVLVSPNADGSKAHQITIPPFKKASITDVIQDSDGKLKITLKAKGEADKDRFYVDVTDNCVGNNPPRCDTVIRDKQGSFVTNQKDRVLSITLPLPTMQSPVTMVFKTSNGEKKTFQIR